MSGAKSASCGMQCSDEAVLLNSADGKIVHLFNLSTYKRIPGALPYTTVMTHDGQRGFVSLWNASAVAELDLVKGTVRQLISLRKPAAPLCGRIASDGVAAEP